MHITRVQLYKHKEYEKGYLNPAYFFILLCFECISLCVCMCFCMKAPPSVLFAQSPFVYELLQPLFYVFLPRGGRLCAAVCHRRAFI